jgi:hypothetical protein
MWIGTGGSGTRGGCAVVSEKTVAAEDVELLELGTAGAISRCAKGGGLGDIKLPTWI